MQIMLNVFIVNVTYNEIKKKNPWQQMKTWQSLEQSVNT